MMTSSNGNISALLAFVRGIRPTKASDAELDVFFEQTVGQTIEMPLICDAIMLIMTLL